MEVSFGIAGFPLGQLGLALPEPPDRVVTQIARAADQAGYGFVCAQDHVLAPREWVGHRRAAATWYDPMVLLGWAAAVTERLRLCTDVLVMPYRSPFMTAKMTASLDAISGGRVIVGVAAGYLEREFDILGAEFERRGDWTDEAIEALKAAWADEWVSFDGEFISAADVAVSPRPVQQPRPPIWIGGNSLRALRRAVEHSDGWTPFGVTAEHVRDGLARARDDWGLDRPLSVAVPLRGLYDGDELDLDAARASLDELTAAGVTHVRVGFRGPDLPTYLRDLEAFARGMGLG